MKVPTASHSGGDALEALARDADGGSRGDVGDASLQTSNGVRPHLLVAEESSELRQYICELLAGVYDVTEVADGQAALAAAQKQKPDLVLAGAYMPLLDGAGLLARLRDDPATADVPILMLSARSGDESQVEALDAAADDYLIKPFSGRELLARVGAHLMLSRLRREAIERERALRIEAETLNEVAGYLTAELDLQALVQKTTAACVRLTGAQFGAFFYNSTGDEGESYVLYALSGAPREAFENLGLPRNTALFGPTFRGEGAVRIDDVKRDPRYGQNAPLEGMPEGHLPVRSYLAVPVTARTGEVIGGLFFGHAKPGMFTERAERLAVGVASQAAAAFENAKLYGAARKEIRERARIEEALRESEQRYRQLVQSLPAAMFTCDAEGRLQLFNDAAVRLWGQAPEAGKTMWTGAYRMYRADGTPLPPEECPMARTLREGRSFSGEEIIIERPDGTRRNVLPHPEPIRDAAGQLVGAVSMVVDITDRKLAEVELAAAKEDLAEQVKVLKESEERFGRFMQHLPGLAWIKDDQGRYVFVNDAAERAFQHSKSELYGRRDDEIFPPKTAAAFRENDRQALESDAGIETVETLEQADGLHHSLVSKFPIPAADGSSRIIGGIAIDVTERFKAEQALIGSEERFRTITMNAPVAVFIKDLEGRYTLCNPLGAEALGRPQGVVGFTDHDLLPAEVADELRRRDLEVISTGDALEGEEIVAQGGVSRQFLSVKFPLQGANGETIGVCGVAVDVTERNQAQVALRESERRLLLATQAGKVGVWAWELESSRVSWSESLQGILGVNPMELAASAEGFEALVHPMDRERVQAAIRAALQSEAPLELEFRAVRPDGNFIWLFTNASVLREGGRPVRMLGATLDITERKRSELALAESEARFRTLASHAPVGIFQSESNGDSVFVNEGWCAMSGLSPEEARGPGWTKAIHPADRERVVAGWQEAVRTGSASEAEFRFMRPDGGVTWLQGNAVPLRDAVGETTGFIGTIVDITARKMAEEALRNSERMYRAIGESIDYGIWVCDAEGRNIYASESFLKLVGLTQEQCSNFGWGEVLHPDDAEQTLAAWQECVRAGATWDVEHRFRGVDGKWHPILARGVPVRSDEGEIVAWVGINLDISELKQVENQLRESEARFRHMADNAPVLIWINGVGGCQFVNKEYLKFVGRPLDELLGMGWSECVHPDDADGYVECYLDAFEHRRPFEGQVRLKRADGEYRWFSSTGAPRFRADGAFLGYVGCSVDITDIKASEEALREADRRKDDFLAMLGHELRNPLAGIVTGAQVLSMLDLDDEAGEMQAVIARQAMHMSRIVDDLLDVSRIARGKLRLRHQYANLRKLLVDTVEDYRKSHSLDSCTLRLEFPETDAWLWADPARLTQAFSNIIHNSFKFGDGPNEITVSMSVDEAGGQAAVVIADRGIGMTSETIAGIFEPFNQADSSLQRSRGGLGLGLALTKGLIRLHGGAVTAESAGLGQGAVFKITLPLVVAPAFADLAPPAAAVAAGQRVLVIDDRLDALLPLNKMLQMEGHTVATAMDGPSGVARAVQFQPDVVLCDIGLAGDMSGYDVCRSLRGRADFAQVYLVAVTGYGHEEARRMARDAGFDYHVAKPVGKQQLEDLLLRRPRF